jgi:RNA polymerase sigma factor (sigma-70 family)
MRLDANDLTRLYDRHASALLAFFARRTLEPEAAADLLAETFAAAFEDREQFRGNGDAAARAWLYGVARHRLLDFYRHGRVERGALGRLGIERRALSEAEYDRIEDLAASSELREAIGRALAGLAASERAVLRLRIVEEPPYAEVARTLGVSEQTARARTSRALRALRSSLAPAEPLEVPDHAQPLS